MFKWLAGAACVAAIAYVAYFFFGEWSRNAAAAANSQAAAISRCQEHAKQRPTERDLMAMSEEEKADRYKTTGECLALLSQ